MGTQGHNAAFHGEKSAFRSVEVILHLPKNRGYHGYHMFDDPNI